MLQIGPSTDGQWRVARSGRIIGVYTSEQEAITATGRLRHRGEMISSKRLFFKVAGTPAAPREAPSHPALEPNARTVINAVKAGQHDEDDLPQMLAAEKAGKDRISVKDAIAWRLALLIDGGE